MMNLSEVLRQAAEQEKRFREACERIYAELGYSEFPPEHVIDEVYKCVVRASIALGTDRERIEFFRVRKALEQKRARILSEEDQCPFCGEPLDAADDHGVRECPECWSKFDRSVKELHL